MTIYVLMVQEDDGRKCVDGVYATWALAHAAGLETLGAGVVDFWVEAKECA